jgi:hypothetical protein
MGRSFSVLDTSVLDARPEWVESCERHSLRAAFFWRLTAVSRSSDYPRGYVGGLYELSTAGLIMTHLQILFSWTARVSSRPAWE